MKMTAIKADITTLAVDVIVNAANSSLLGGGGVDGAIHSAAGPELLQECITLNGCRVGQAKISSSYQLPAKKIIHTVGPYWRGGRQHEAEELAACYKNSLLIAEEFQLSTVAFPAISTGVYGYPKELAAQVAIDAVQEFSALHPNALKEVIFCCYSDQDLAIYQALLTSKVKLRERSTVIIRHTDKLLFVKEKNGDWLLPGGTVKFNEPAIAAACREVYEETGANIKKVEYLFEHKSLMNHHFVFLVTLHQSDSPAIVSEIVDLQWLSPEMFATVKTSPGTRFIVEKIQASMFDI